MFEQKFQSLLYLNCDSIILKSKSIWDSFYQEAPVFYWKKTSNTMVKTGKNFQHNGKNRKNFQHKSHIRHGRYQNYVIKNFFSILGVLIATWILEQTPQPKTEAAQVALKLIEVAVINSISFKTCAYVNFKFVISTATNHYRESFLSKKY